MIEITKDTNNIKVYSPDDKGNILISKVFDGYDQFGKTLEVLYIKPCGTETDMFIVGSTFHQNLIQIIKE